MSIALTAGANTLSTAYTIERATTPTQIVNKGLDGTTYVQILGSPVTTYKLRAIIDDETDRTLTDAAWANGTPIKDNGSDIGVITSITWQGPLPSGAYLADITTAL